MKKYLLLLLLLQLISVFAAEKLVKLEGTSKEIGDIVVDQKGRWYMVQDKKLCISLDRGVTCKTIELPSNEPVLPNLGIDQLDNIIVQDDKFNVFKVGRKSDENFFFDKLRLSNNNEKLVSKPFVVGENIVCLATKSGLMTLENETTYADSIETPPHSRTSITQWISANYTNRFDYEFASTLFSGGGIRNWIYVKMGYFINPLKQMKSTIKHMNAVIDRVYCIVAGDKEVNVISYMDNRYDLFTNRNKHTYSTKVKGLDVSKMRIENEFIAYLPENDYKTYIYGNIDNSGVVYELRDKKINSAHNTKMENDHQAGGFKVDPSVIYHPPREPELAKYDTKVENEHKLDNVKILCSTIEGSKLYFGTSDGIYEMTDIQPKKVD